jgi:hypothetical protein
MNELLEAAMTVLRRSSAPMTLAQIWTAAKRETRAPAKDKDRFANELRELTPEQAGVYSWPEFQRSAVYCSRPLESCVEEALLRSLDEQPLDQTRVAQEKRASLLARPLRLVSKTQVAKQINLLLPRLSASGAIVRLSAGRQAAVYLSKKWMAMQAGGRAGDDALRSVLPQVVARLQSGPGNYVRVDHLRLAPEILAIFDRAVIELADRRQLVLGHFDGPYPVPDDRKWNYVEDGRGELFVGVALPRDSEA